MRRLLAAALLLLICMTPRDGASAERSAPAEASVTLATAEFVDGTTVWRVRVVADESGHSTALVSSSAGLDSAKIALPFAPSSEGWRASLAWLPAVTGGPLLGVEIAVGADAEEAHFSALLRPSGRRDGGIEVVWRSGRSEAGTGASWQLLDSDGDGRMEVVVAEADRRLAACSGRLWLHPAVVGGASAPKLLHRASLGRLDAAVARPEAAVVLDRFALDGAVSWVSHADAGLGAPNAAAALHDNREDTVWAPSRDNPAGEFAVIKMVEGVALDGITLGLPAASAEATFLLHFGAATRRVVVSAGTTVTVQAPTPVSSGCTAVEVLSKRGSRPLLVSTLRPVTELDRQPVEAIFERVLLPLLKRARNSGERSVVIRWLGTAGPALLPHLERALRDELAERQSVLVLAALELEGGDEMLAHLAVEGVLDDESIATWNRTNRHLSEAALTVVLAQFRDGAADIRLLPLVARTPTEEGNEAFLRLLRSPSQTVRRAAMASLPPNSPTLLAAVLEQALDGSAEERAEWLAMALKLSRHQRALAPGPTADAVTSLIDRLLSAPASGDLRIAVTLVGALAMEERREQVAQLARHADNEWVRVSSLEAIARWRGTTEAQRNEASALLTAALRDPSPSVRMRAAALFAREPLLTLPVGDSLALLQGEAWTDTRGSLIRMLARGAELSVSLPEGLVAWVAGTTERERLAFLADFRPTLAVADDGWLALDDATQDEPAARRALLFALGRQLTEAQRRFAERVTADRLEADEVRLAAATVLARSGAPSWQAAATALLTSESAAAAERAAELLCAWTPDAARGELSDVTRYPSPYALVTETLRTCKDPLGAPAAAEPPTPR
jgi:hypothetical protein